MEELFKSLSESVSEECYNEIMGIVENILSEDIESAIIKKHGTPKYNSWREDMSAVHHTPANKSTELLKAAKYNKDREMEDAEQSPKKKAELKRYNDSKDEVANRNFLRGSANDVAYRNKKTNDVNTQTSRMFFSGDEDHIENPKYNKFKKLARKALRGHEQEGTQDPDDIYYRGISSPKELFKIGREVFKRQKKNKVNK